MAIYHATLMFTQAPLGWVEQFYRTDVSLQSALAAGLSLATARYSCVGAGVGIARLRVSEVGYAHNSLAANVPGRPVSAVAISPFVRAMIRMASVGPVLHRRSYVMGGLPASAIIGGPGTAVWSGPYGVAAQAWLALLISQGWQMQVWQPLGLPLPLVGVTEGVTVGGDIYGGPLAGQPALGQPSYLFAQTVGGAPEGGSLVHVAGAKVNPPFPMFRKRVNGNWPILAYLPNGVAYSGTFGGGSYVAGGTLTVQQVQYLGISQASLTSMVARKCGPAKLDVDSTPLPPPAPKITGSGLPPASPRGPVVIPPYTPVEPTHEYQTLGDVADQIWSQYLTAPAPISYLISMGQVVGTERPTFVFFLGGQDTTIIGEDFNQWWGSINSYFGLEDRYTTYLRKIINEDTPDGCELILIGHSLGGMAAQQVESFLPQIGSRRIQLIVGFGTVSYYFNQPGGILSIAPPLNKPPPGIRLFCVRGDPLPYISPGGNALWILMLTAPLTGGAIVLEQFIQNLVQPGWQTILTPPANVDVPDWVGFHMCYPNCKDIGDYNWNGLLDPDQLLPPLITGPLTYYPYPPP